MKKIGIENTIEYEHKGKTYRVIYDNFGVSIFIRGDKDTILKDSDHLINWSRKDIKNFQEFLTKLSKTKEMEESK